jgi:hypothetical protein
MKLIYFILGVLAICSSCSMQKMCERRYPPVTKTHDSILYIHEIHDSIIPGIVITDTFYKTEIQKLPAYYPVYKKDTKSEMVIRMYKDSLGNIIADCEGKDKVISKYKELSIKASMRDSVDVKIIHKAPTWYWILFGIWSLILIFFCQKIKIAG